VTEDELEALAEAGMHKSLDVGLFSLTFGVAITVLITLVTVDITDAKLNAGFVAVLAVSVILSIYFGIRALGAWRDAARKLEKLKQTPP